MASRRRGVPLNLGAVTETHDVKVVINSRPDPADARVQRGKDIALFVVALSLISVLAGYCLYLVIFEVGSADQIRWAQSLLAAVAGGLLGYLLPKHK
jgi:hypothetical protein